MMNNMKKTITTIAALAVMLSASACATQENNSGSDASDNASASITVEAATDAAESTSAISTQAPEQTVVSDEAPSGAQEDLWLPETGNATAAFCDRVLEANTVTSLCAEYTDVTYTGRITSIETGDYTETEIVISEFNGQPAASCVSGYGDTTSYELCTQVFACASDSYGAGALTILPIQERERIIDDYFDLFFADGDFIVDLTQKDGEYILTTGYVSEEQGINTEKIFCINPEDHTITKMIINDLDIDGEAFSVTELDVKYNSGKEIEAAAYDRVFTGDDLCKTTFAINVDDSDNHFCTFSVARDINLFAKTDEGLVQFCYDKELTEPVQWLENSENDITIYAENQYKVIE